MPRKLIRPEARDASGNVVPGVTWRLHTYDYTASFFTRNDDGGYTINNTQASLPMYTAPIGGDSVTVLQSAADGRPEAVAYIDPGEYALVGTLGDRSYVELHSVVDLLGIERSIEPEPVIGKNLIDLSKVNYTQRYSTGTQNFVNDTLGIAATGYIKVEEGKTYNFSGVGVYNYPDATQGGYFDSDNNPVGLNVAFSDSADSSKTFTVPSGSNIFSVVLSLDKLNNDASATSLNGDVQLEVGSVPTDFEAYSSVYIVPHENLERDPDGTYDGPILLNVAGKNLANPEEFNTESRYSTGSKAIITDALLPIARTGYIAVEPGEFYVISGDGSYTPSQGGYFTSAGNLTAIDNINFVVPVDGVGSAFQVPLDSAIKYAVVNLNEIDGEIDGDFQLEAGEQVTDFASFKIEQKINPDYLPDERDLQASSSILDVASYYKFVDGEDNFPHEGIPVFKKSYLLKDKNLVVANTGTSLTARSIEHATNHPDAAIRPPLMHSNNFASIIWDKLLSGWQGQQYRRYDSEYFVEAGSWVTQSNIADWDDGAFRSGLTRYSDGAASSIGFDIPIDAWQFNFIYRSDAVSTESASISVESGNGKVEVFDGENWVEANGYVFSQRETEVITRTVSVPNHLTDVFSDQTSQSKGNTTYQKRLKMRCNSAVIDSRSEVKTLTISTTTDRLTYWGVEWSVREFMITYINAARGSHNTRSLVRFADNELHDFKPDLILSENPIHNDGAAAASVSAGGVWGRLTNNFFFRSDYELSLENRASFFGYTPEFAIFTASIAYNFNGINEDGSLKFSEQLNGEVMSALDKYTQAHEWITENRPDVISINAAQRWVDAGFAIFGDLRTATEGSGKNGPTFTNEGSHWNDTGSKVMAKVVLPALNFSR